jgi:hypothetical protein
MFWRCFLCPRVRHNCVVALAKLNALVLTSSEEHQCKGSGVLNTPVLYAPSHARRDDKTNQYSIECTNLFWEKGLGLGGGG